MQKIEGKSYLDMTRNTDETPNFKGLLEKFCRINWFHYLTTVHIKIPLFEAKGGT